MKQYPATTIAAVAVFLASFGRIQAQSSTTVEPMCGETGSVVLLAGETRTLPEILFRITAGKWSTYSLTRTIIVPSEAHCTVSNARFFLCRTADAGNDCTLADNAPECGPNSGPFVRIDDNVQHTTGDKDELPDETTLWVSVRMDVTGTSSGTGTITIECTIDNYSF